MDTVRGEVNRYGLSLTIPVCHNLVCSPLRFISPLHGSSLSPFLPHPLRGA